MADGGWRKAEFPVSASSRRLLLDSSNSNSSSRFSTSSSRKRMRPFCRSSCQPSQQIIPKKHHDSAVAAMNQVLIRAIYVLKLEQEVTEQTENKLRGDRYRSRRTVTFR